MDIARLVEETEEREVLEFLTEYGYLQGAAHGIALQVLKSGTESLTAWQSYVFGKFIAKKYLNMECSRCREPMPASEVIYAILEADGLCSWCNKMAENDD